MLTPTQEAQVLELINQQAALLSLANNEATITSKLAATKVNLSELTLVASLADSDLVLVRQGIVDKSATGAAVKALAQTGAVLTTGNQSIAGTKTFSSTIAGSITGNAATATTAGDGVPPGAVLAFARNTAPTGWLKANGAEVSRTTYAALFTAIGTTFGVGNGTTTFNVPDLRGEFPRGWDDARGVDAGRVFGSTQADELKSHQHTSPDGSAFITASAGGAFGGGGSSLWSSGSALVQATGGTETRPRNIALLFCIKF